MTEKDHLSPEAIAKVRAIIDDIPKRLASRAEERPINSELLLKALRGEKIPERRITLPYENRGRSRITRKRDK